MIKYVTLIIAMQFLVSCGATTEVKEVPVVEVRTVEVKKPAPIVPNVDQLSLRPVNWIIITPDNVDDKFNQIQSGELVLFAVTANGYENIALNLSDIRAMIEQQKKIIAIYQSQFK